MKNLATFSLAVITIVLFLLSDPVLAGPGGKIVSAVYETFWGKVILFLLFIFFLPLIMLQAFEEKRAEKRARKDLAFMAKQSDVFDWLSIQQRVKDCFFRVHKGWCEEDLSETSGWMTDWYLQNQQMVYLETWKARGVRNFCQVKKINSMTPIMFQHRNSENNHQGSKLVVSVMAKMNDYLEQIDTGKIIEGSKKFKEVETIWMFILEQGSWKVSDIEEASTLMDYVKASKELPPIESTLDRSI